MRRILMYGYHSESRMDLPAGYVRGFGKSFFETYIDVGFFKDGVRKRPFHK